MTTYSHYMQPLQQTRKLIEAIQEDANPSPVYDWVPRDLQQATGFGPDYIAHLVSEIERHLATGKEMLARTPCPAQYRTGYPEALLDAAECFLAEFTS